LRRDDKSRARFDQWNSRNAMHFEEFGLGQPRALEKRIRAGVTILEVAREKDNSARIAIAPLDANLLSIN
jgi:hypothetical protein